MTPAAVGSLKVLEPMDLKDEKWRWNAPICVTNNQQRQTLNRERVMQFARECGEPVIVFDLRLSAESHAVLKNKDEQRALLYRTHTDCLQFRFVRNAPAILGDNVSVTHGAANGSAGTLHSLCLDPREPAETRALIANAQPCDEVFLKFMPLSVNMKLTDLPPELDPVTTPFNSHISVAHRRANLMNASLVTDGSLVIACKGGWDKEYVTTSKGGKIGYFPMQVQLRFSVTFHRLQALTLPCLIIELNASPMKALTLASVYVALSRVRRGEDLRILGFQTLEDAQALYAMRQPQALRDFFFRTTGLQPAQAVEWKSGKVLKERSHRSRLTNPVAAAAKLAFSPPAATKTSTRPRAPLAAKTSSGTAPSSASLAANKKLQPPPPPPSPLPPPPPRKSAPKPPVAPPATLHELCERWIERLTHAILQCDQALPHAQPLRVTRQARAVDEAELERFRALPVVKNALAHLRCPSQRRPSALFESLLWSDALSTNTCSVDGACVSLHIAFCLYPHVLASVQEIQRGNAPSAWLLSHIADLGRARDIAATILDFHRFFLAHKFEAGRAVIIRELLRHEMLPRDALTANKVNVFGAADLLFMLLSRMDPAFLFPVYSETKSCTSVACEYADPGRQCAAVLLSTVAPMLTRNASKQQAHERLVSALCNNTVSAPCADRMAVAADANQPQAGRPRCRGVFTRTLKIVSLPPIFFVEDLLTSRYTDSLVPELLTTTAAQYRKLATQFHNGNHFNAVLDFPAPGGATFRAKFDGIERCTSVEFAPKQLQNFSIQSAMFVRAQ